MLTGVRPLCTCPDCGRLFYTYQAANEHNTPGFCPGDPLLNPPHDPNDRTHSVDADPPASTAKES